MQLRCRSRAGVHGGKVRRCTTALDSMPAAYHPADHCCQLDAQPSQQLDAGTIPRHPPGGSGPPPAGTPHRAGGAGSPCVWDREQGVAMVLCGCTGGTGAAHWHMEPADKQHAPCSTLHQPVTDEASSMLELCRPPARAPEDEAGAPSPLERKAGHRGVQLCRVLMRQAVGQDVVRHDAEVPGRHRCPRCCYAGRRRGRVHERAVVQGQCPAGRLCHVVREAAVGAEAAVAAQVVDAGWRGGSGGAAAASAAPAALLHSGRRLGGVDRQVCGCTTQESVQWAWKPAPQGPHASAIVQERGQWSCASCD